ncbi:MAG: cryptochrome/photolyase family protein [Flexibacter sp. CG_4_10_14_3_um_filter_32_15]|nr:MAG: cryptochrome/photolyase family protein [Flexibacter sp. CG_4_10_14_3_um_filter_32_15]
MKSINLIFPHQLFKENLLLLNENNNEKRSVFLIEDDLYFGQYPFHKQKLLLHRASMHYYQSFLEKKGYEVSYLEHSKYGKLETVFELLNEEKIIEIHYVDTTDYLVERRLTRFSEKFNIKLIQYQTPLFLTSKEELDKILQKTKLGSYLMATFYQKQRKRLDILMNSDGSPKGGKWSFDDENRKSLPKPTKGKSEKNKLQIPKFPVFEENSFVKKYKPTIESEFGDNYGFLEEFNYPTTHEEAEQVLDTFLKERFHLFGDYEDAISTKERIIFHSVLTPALNIGLLIPKQIIEKAISFASQSEGTAQEIPINSLEGFIRQIIGWREFMRGVYEKESVFERTNNFFDFKREIPKSFYEGTTGIIPIDETIKKVLKYGYCHHIERLMILGNFMLLCEFSPDAVYRWFMELFIDAYDWVMVGNTYGMTQYADGGLITTKPYISGSNYVLKMSDYSKTTAKENNWTEIWNGLYWNFIHSHKEVFATNHRMRMMVSMLDKMKKETLQNHLENANDFLEKLDKELEKK